MDPSSRYTLKNVNFFFSTAVRTVPVPELFLSPERFHDIRVFPISLRKLMKIAGRGSGLLAEIGNIIRKRQWVNAWIF